jgi:hypothetical protein
MNLLQQNKTVIVAAPAARVNNASVTTNVIDTFGFNKVEIQVILGDLDIALTNLRLQESDVATNATTLSSPTDIPGTIFGTSIDPDTGVAAVLPTATDDNKIYKFFVDCAGRKRYIDPLITVGNGTAGAFVTVIANLSNANETPTSAAERGAAVNLIV